LETSSRSFEKSLPDALGSLIGRSGDGITHVGAGFQERHLDFAEIHVEACRRAALLRGLGTRQGDRIALVVLDEMEMLLSFLGIAMAGMVPVMVAPRHVARGSGNRDTLNHIVASSGTRLMIVSAALAGDLDLPGTGCAVASVEEVFAPGPGLPAPPLAPIDPHSPCFLQYTSGSTGQPKGTIVTHANIAACTALCANVTLRSDGGRDVAVSWVPLYHDLGLIGFFLTPLLHHVPLVLMSPMLFARRPLMWLELMTAKRATVSAAPPFAFPLLLRRLRDGDLAGLDLSHLRVLMCGAEPIRKENFDALAARLRPAGFDPDCFVPCYGLAEATLAVTSRRKGQPVRVDSVSAPALGLGTARPPVAGESSRTLVSCGPPVDWHRVTIVDDAGQPLPERTVGEIVIEGPAVSPGYCGDAAATAQSIRDGRLHSGDLGYLDGGELFVCGRLKDLIIVRGANFVPQDFEWTVGQLAEMRGRASVAFAVEEQGVESFVVVVEAPMSSDDRRSALSAAAAEAITREHGVTPARVVVVQPGTIPLTTSGKVQRGRVRDMYHADALNRRALPADGLGL
jgi:fatty-acyl-CoA synthase